MSLGKPRLPSDLHSFYEGDAIAIAGERALSVARLRDAFEAWLPDYMAGEVAPAA